ncbi:MAG TPA: tetratricopeptide repeat protein [Thermoanaerobaculia bacterium]|nr:tetratricopeptide repeat protein [Thermoanaerobaculia bacterium]
MRFLVVVSALACIWSYGTTLRGRKVQVEGARGVDLETHVLNRDSSTDWKERRAEYAARVAKTADPEVRNDYAVTLLHTGETAEAIRILRALEKERPGRYETAVNLGTALELAGQNAEALRWIREGIRRNSNAHDGTEWLHVRILEAKLALARDPKWLATHSIVGLDFGQDVVPKKLHFWPDDNRGREATPSVVRRAFYYQIDERVDFVKPPDPVFAGLLFDWGNLEMLTGTLETAEVLYVEALQYRPQNESLLRARLAHVRKLLKKK